jgi:hypothetical protein
MKPTPLPTRPLALLVAGVVLTGCTSPLDSPSPVPASAGPTTVAGTVAPSGESSAVPSRSPAPAAPTVGPDPTPAVTSPPRTEIEINANVVDRPGVPAALRDNYWWTGSDVGLLGTTAQLGLPSRERVIHAADGFVVAGRPRSDGEPGTELVVRRFETGTEIAQVHTLQVRVDARIAGGRLFWTGMRPESACPGVSVDGGVWVLGLTLGSVPVAIVEPGRSIEGSCYGRMLLLSSSRETIAALMTGHDDQVWMDVIDVATLAHESRIRNVWPWAMTDDTSLQWDEQPSDFMDVGWGMTAHDLANRDIRWRFPDSSDLDRFAPYPIMALGAEFVVQYVWDDSPTDIIVIHAAFDPHTGERRELLRQENAEERLTARLDLSAETHVVLEAGREPSIVGTFSTLEVSTGILTRDAFTIDPPWLCTDEGCFRD